MMLAAVETVTKADPVWESRRHNSDVAAQATAGEAVERHGRSLVDRSGHSRTLAQATIRYPGVERY